jgi:hypothetical protein
VCVIVVREGRYLEYYDEYKYVLLGRNSFIHDMVTLGDDARCSTEEPNLPTHVCSLLSLVIAVSINDTEMCAPEHFLVGRCQDLTRGA